MIWSWRMVWALRPESRGMRGRILSQCPCVGKSPPGPCGAFDSRATIEGSDGSGRRRNGARFRLVQGTPAMTKGYSTLIDKAATIAAIVHRRQVRKTTSIPYFMHPAHVALILARHGYPDELQAAALLHDVLEDADEHDLETRKILAGMYTAFDDSSSDPQAFRRALSACLRREVGDTVVSFIEAVSDVTTYANGRRIPWPERKRIALAHYDDALTPDEVLVLKGADVLHNVQSIRQALETQGLSAMHRFSGTPDQTVQDYAAVSGIIARRLATARHASLVGEMQAAVLALQTLLLQLLDDMRGRVAAVSADAAS